MKLTKAELEMIAANRAKNAAKKPKAVKAKAKKTVKAKAVKVPKAKVEKKVKITKPVHVKKVERKIAKMTDETLAKKAAKLLAESPNKNNRVGDDCSMAEKNLMIQMQAAKLSYKNIERVFDMLPANGMNAFRSAEDAKAHNRAEKVRSTRAANKVAEAAVSAPTTTQVAAPTVETAKVETPAPVAAPAVPEPVAEVTNPVAATSTVE